MTERRPPVLEVRRLCKTYGRVSALTDVDLEVQRGEVLAVLGNNGAGKSSLVEILAGVERPDSGTIAVNGALARIDRPDTAHALGIATVFQDLGLCTNMTIVENMYLGRELGGFLLDDATMTEHAAQLLRQLTRARSASTPRSPISPAPSGRSWPSPVRCSATRASWCWTSPPRRSASSSGPWCST